MYNTNYMNTKVARRLSPSEERFLAFKRIPGTIGSGVDAGVDAIGSGLGSVGSAIMNNPGRLAQLGGSGYGAYKGINMLRQGLGGASGNDPLRLGVAALGAGLTGAGLLGGADAVTGNDYFLGRLGRRIANSSDKDRRVAQGLLGGAGLFGGMGKATLAAIGGDKRKAALYGLLGLAGGGTLLDSILSKKPISDPSRFSDFTGVSSGVRGIGGPVVRSSSDLMLDSVSKGSLLEGLIPGIGNANLSKSVTDEMDRREKVKEDAAKLQMGKDLGDKASPFMDKLLESVPFTSQRARAAKEEREKEESLYEMFSDMTRGEGAKGYEPKEESLYEMFSDMTRGEGAKDYKPKPEPTNFADLVPQYIRDNPGKSVLGAGLGSALVYNALGGREGIQEKLEAMRRNPGATAAGLGSLGVLSAATYDAMREKNSQDTNPRTAGPAALFGDLYLGNPKNEDGKSDIEVKSQNEGNILAGADKGIDTTIEYLPYLLAAGALGGAGYGGYKLVDYLKDKKEDREKKASDEYVPKTLERKSYLKEIADTVPTSMLATAGLGALGWGLPEYLESGSILKALASAARPAAMGAGFGIPIGIYGGITHARHHNKKVEELLNKESAHGRSHESKFTKEYDNHPSLVGKQKNLPDMIQKKIVDSHSKKAAHGSSPEHKYTQEYNHHNLLQGKQKTELPDFLQKEIIDSRSKAANFLRSLYS